MKSRPGREQNIHKTPYLRFDTVFFEDNWKDKDRQTLRRSKIGMFVIVTNVVDSESKDQSGIQKSFI